MLVVPRHQAADKVLLSAASLCEMDVDFLECYVVVWNQTCSGKHMLFLSGHFPWLYR